MNLHKKNAFLLSKQMDKKLKALFFIFVFIQGFFYLFLIPPWQSPDECRHFGYGILVDKDKKIKPNLDKKIVESMNAFHAWKYQSLTRPHTLPNRLRRVPFYGISIAKMSRQAPLYYLLSSFIIKRLKINGILNQFYVIRSFSFILFLLSVYFTYLSARILFKDNFLYCFATVSFVAFLPQFLIVSTSVNSANLAVLLETIFIYLMILSIHKGKRLLIVLFGPIVIALGFFNHQAALFMIPPFLVLLLIYFINSLKNKRDLLRILLILLIIVLIFLALYLVANHLFPSLLEQVVRESSLKPRIAEINRFIKYLSSTSSLNVFLDGFFMSFWYFSGWMRFCYLPDIYSVLKLISFLSFLGLFKYLFFTLSRKNYKTSVDFPSFLILIAAGLPLLLGAIIFKFPIAITTQGRYIFPAISALAVLFVLGLKEIVPKKFENWLPVFVIVGFIVLNIYTIFNSLIRVFYYFTNA